MSAVARHTGVWGDTLLSYYVEIVEGSSRIIEDHPDSFMCGGVHKCIAKFILVCANVLQSLLFTYKKQGLCVTRKWIVPVKVDFDSPLSGESGF